MAIVVVDGRSHWRDHNNNFEIEKGKRKTSSVERRKRKRLESAKVSAINQAQTLAESL